MATAESLRPGDDSENGEETAPAESGTTLKKAEQNVFYSAGVISPEVNRILGSHIEHFPSERPSDDDDEFCEPFGLLAKTEDGRMIEFSERASECGIPTRFLRERVQLRSSPIDYFKILKHWVDLVLYNVKKITGNENADDAIPLAGNELRGKAVEAAKRMMTRPESIQQLEHLSVDLQQYIEKLAKNI